MAGFRFTGRCAEDIAVALTVRPLGRLHRYNRVWDEVAVLERDCAVWQGVSNSLARTSGGQALQIRAAGAGLAKLFDMRLPPTFTVWHCDKNENFLLAEADRLGLGGAA